MKLSELIRKKENVTGSPVAVATVTVATLATVTPVNSPSVANVASVNVATAADDKPKTLSDRQSEERRQKVLSMLADNPDTKRAIITDLDSDPDNVILTIAICDLATFEMLVPKGKYDPFLLLDFIHAQETVKH